MRRHGDPGTKPIHRRPANLAPPGVAATWRVPGDRSRADRSRPAPFGYRIGESLSIPGIAELIGASNDQRIRTGLSRGPLFGIRPHRNQSLP